ncbi:biotin transporter BioY [Clostridium minihomine]|uniref:biotin transporter BioY n=1 Tax=Clostridium minihomine TaxID=2045012 RepID=UPI000C78891C|nr:biotin transporter BioY [Clostridium minihomine]
MKTKHLAMTAMFTALTMVLGPLVIVLPFTPVPISLAMIPIYLSGALLPKRNAFTALFVYLLLGAAGLPVFSQFRGGLGVLVGPTGGFLLVYPIMAFVIAFLLEKLPQQKIHSLLIAFSVALAICYMGGCLMFLFLTHVDLAKALSLTVLPFLPLDLVKVAFSAVVAIALKKALHHAKLLPLA